MEEIDEYGIVVKPQRDQNICLPHNPFEVVENLEVDMKKRQDEFNRQKRVYVEKNDITLVADFMLTKDEYTSLFSAKNVKDASLSKQKLV